MFFCAKLLFYCTQLRFAQLYNKAYDDDDDVSPPLLAGVFFLPPFRFFLSLFDNTMTQKAQKVMWGYVMHFDEIWRLGELWIRKLKNWCVAYS